jgi:O-methyltransferase involved in polyketide biosynthesis
MINKPAESTLPGDGEEINVEARWLDSLKRREAHWAMIGSGLSQRVVYLSESERDALIARLKKAEADCEAAREDAANWQKAYEQDVRLDTAEDEIKELLQLAADDKARIAKAEAETARMQVELFKGFDELADAESRITALERVKEAAERVIDPNRGLTQKQALYELEKELRASPPEPKQGMYPEEAGIDMDRDC